MATAKVAQPRHYSSDIERLRAIDTIEPWHKHFSREDVSLEPVSNLLRDAIGHEEYERFLEEVKGKHDYKHGARSLRESIISTILHVTFSYLCHIHNETHAKNTEKYDDIFDESLYSLRCLFPDLLKTYFLDEELKHDYCKEALDAAKDGLYHIVDVLINLGKIKVEEYGVILEEAAENGHESIVRRILTEATAKCIIIPTEHLSEACIRASKLGHVAVVKLILKMILISKRCYINSFKMAAANGQLLIVDQLLNNPVATIDRNNFRSILDFTLSDDKNYLIVRRLLDYAKMHPHLLRDIGSVLVACAHLKYVQIVQEIINDPIVMRNIPDKTLALAKDKASECSYIYILILGEQKEREKEKKECCYDCAKGHSPSPLEVIRNPLFNRDMTKEEFDEQFELATRDDNNRALVRELIDYAKAHSYAFKNLDEIFMACIEGDRFDIGIELFYDLYTSKKISTPTLRRSKEIVKKIIAKQEESGDAAEPADLLFFISDELLYR